MNRKPKLLAVVGPTSSGKSDIAVELALRFNGEVVSADSRQIYRGLDIGTGKITPEEMRGVPHHLLDIRDPQEEFSVAEFKGLADKAILDISLRGKLPILAGGTGYYVQAVIDGIIPPEVPANKKLRKELEGRTADELFEQLLAKDPERAQTIDRHNPRRLIRALEIADALSKIPPLKKEEGYDALQIGLTLPKEELRERVNQRLTKRINEGMVEEAQRLHAEGLTYERMEALGLECRYLARHLQGHLTLEEMQRELEFKSWQYAKRQMTWFKRDKKITWFHPKNLQEALNMVELWLA